MINYINLIETTILKKRFLQIKYSLKLKSLI